MQACFHCSESPYVLDKLVCKLLVVYAEPLKYLQKLTRLCVVSCEAHAFEEILCLKSLHVKDVEKQFWKSEKQASCNVPSLRLIDLVCVLQVVLDVSDVLPVESEVLTC